MNGEASSGRDDPASVAGGLVSSDARLCRLCLMAAIVFAFGKEALMFI